MQPLHFPLTLVHHWLSIPEEHQSGQGLDAILISQAGLLSGDEVHAVFVCVIINVLQLIQDLVTLLAFLTPSTWWDKR